MSGKKRKKGQKKKKNENLSLSLSHLAVDASACLMTSPSSTAMNQLAAGCCREGEEAEEEAGGAAEEEERRRLEEEGPEQTPPTDRSASSAAAATPLGVASPLENARWYSAMLRRLGEVSGSAAVEGEAAAVAAEEALAAAPPPGKSCAAACALRAGLSPPSPTATSPAQPRTGSGEPEPPVSLTDGHSGDQQGASGALACRSARGMPDLLNCAALRQESQGCSAIQATRGMMGPARRGTLLVGCGCVCVCVGAPFCVCEFREEVEGFFVRCQSPIVSDETETLLSLLPSLSLSLPFAYFIVRTS